MGKMKYNTNKTLIKNKAFYIALLVCLAALGLTSYATVSRISQYNVTSSTPQSSLVSSYSPANQEVHDASYPIVSQQEEMEPTATDLAVEDDSVLTGTAPFFTLPITGEIIKEYDPKVLQYSETYKDWRLHLGVDFAGEKGNPVFSCAQGVVEDIYNDPDYGTVVAIDHGDGIVGYYCGLNAKPVVKLGEQVEAGKQIGVIDSIPCECVEQAHLHFYMEKDGEPISPLDVIKE